MALVEMLMPKMGESIIEGTVLKWLKNIGDRIEEDESVLEVATDKVDTEIPALEAGILREILAQEGEVVAVGKAIAIIDTEGSSNEPKTVTTPNQVAPSPPAPAPVSEPASAPTPAVTSTGAANEGRFYSPLVMNIARQENIPMAELDQVPGTGLEGRVTKKDIFAYLENRNTAETNPSTNTAPVAAPAATPTQPIMPAPATEKPTPASSKPSASVSGTNEIIEMDRMRKMIAQRMIDSKRISPHVTSFVEADVTNLVNWRNKMKDAYKKREGENLTFTPIFLEAVAKAIRDFPMINVSVEGDTIIKKRDINIGLAVALPTGNLIVPVIKNADQMNL
ncbi:MAG: 2-oxoglutarate dehydrogenase, partial [Cytophagales bacterium CG18_big_fil_WC_8_21_14_2_50_42_9]